ncbi:MAG: hypothetical protein ACI4KD_04800 [Oscillospiraceae bacterium]
MDKYQIKERISELQNKISESEKLIYELEIEKKTALDIASETGNIDRESSNILSDIHSAIQCEGIGKYFDGVLSDMGADFNIIQNNLENPFEEQIAENKRKIQQYNEELTELEIQSHICDNFIF